MTVSFEELCAETLSRCREKFDEWADRLSIEDCDEGFLDNLASMEISEASHEVLPMIDLQSAVDFLSARPELFEGEIGRCLKQEMRRMIVSSVVQEAEEYACSLGIGSRPIDVPTPTP
ncbi:MAG: hypothetical protein ABS75_25925 [Pelagibacterium sp. SCN 63-23]|nr:MAG: hypothetical protein ABS75_25925 [Pelagibacterium sp. SCN 63-23]